MRIDATIPDSDGKQLARLAKELGLSRSELVSEAVSYFVRLSMEVRAGRLLLLHDPQGGAPPRELVSRHLGAFRALPVPQPRVSSRELARVRKLTPYKRMAEALELDEDGVRPTSARSRSR